MAQSYAHAGRKRFSPQSIIVIRQKTHLLTSVQVGLSGRVLTFADATRES